MTTLCSFICGFLCLGLADSFENITVYQCLIDKGFTSFVQLLNESYLQTMLTGAGRMTVFAPSNLAIAGLNPDLLAKLARNPVEKRDLMRYHIVPDNYILVPTVTGRKIYKTLEGQDLEIWHIGSSLILNNHSRVDPSPNNDYVCNNGVVQPVDHVLIPPVFGGDNVMAVLIERDDLFQDFTMGAMLANMTHLLESGEYTVFAPTDAAYAKFQSQFWIDGLDYDTRIKGYADIVKYHVVPGKRTINMLSNGQSLFTLHGTQLDINLLTNGDVLVNGLATVTSPDISAANGVVHAIDTMMIPTDMKHLVNPAFHSYVVG